jgi:hypothetical protein
MKSLTAFVDVEVEGHYEYEPTQPQTPSRATSVRE